MDTESSGHRSGSPRRTWQDEVGALAESVSGPVLVAGANGYDEETAVFNQSVTHRPAVVVGAEDAADVSTAVRFAARHDLNVAVLNTGHGPSLASTDNTLLITTRRMKFVTVDFGRKSARVEAGVLFQQLVEATTAGGLAPLAGSSPSVGVIGYTLGGGASATMGRKYGWAADHVTSIDVVTADGVQHHVSAQAEADLFGALLGGKSNFGVVTAMEMDLFPVTHLYAGALFYSGADAREVLEAYQRLSASASDDLTSGIAFLNFPPLPTLPPFLQGKLGISVRLSYVGRPEDGERLIAPLRAAAPILMDTVSLKPYAEFGAISMDPTDPAPAIEHFGLLDEMASGTIDAILDAVGPGSGSRINLVDIRHLGGAYSRTPETPNAVGFRGTAYALFGLTVVPPGEEVATFSDAGRELIDKLGPWLSETKHPSFLAPGDATVKKVRQAYEPSVYEWLRSIKATYDPANRFRVNHNIPPQQAV